MNNSIKKALTKYNESVKPFTIRINVKIINQMLEYCKQKDITKKTFIENAIQYYIDNH